MDESDVLLAARQVIIERGHVKGLLEDEQGRVCLMGALNLVENGHPYSWGNHRGVLLATDVSSDPYSRSSLWRALQELHPDFDAGSELTASHWLVTFNNHPDTTVDEVLFLLEYAAKIARG